MDRKEFILTSAMSAFALTTCGSVIKGSTGEFTGDCDTTNDILGPFYRPKAPIRSDLTYEGLSGNVITLKGKVFKADCITPLQDALVEIWHCNTEGEYDNDGKDFRQRAAWKTDAEGAYSFKTILPGKYLNGALYRPSHIHYRVTENNSQDLVSQIYFQGDPHITKDPWASKDNAELRILPIALEDTNGNLSINFDIYLAGK